MFKINISIFILKIRVFEIFPNLLFDSQLINMIKIFLNIIILTSMNDLPASNCYSLLPTLETASEYLMKFNRDINEVDIKLSGHNNGHVIILENGEYVFIPNYRDFPNFIAEIVIVFSSKECFEEIYNTDNWPILYEPRTIFEKLSTEMVYFPENIQFFKNVIEKEFNIQIISGTVEELESIRSLVSKVLKKTKLNLNDHLVLLSYYIFIAEIIKLKTASKWILLKDYGAYGPFYFPTLKKENGRILFRSLYDRMGSLKYMSINVFIEDYVNSEKFWPFSSYHKTLDGKIFILDISKFDQKDLPENLNQALKW